MNKAIFFDRDGVINETLIVDGVSRPPKNLETTFITIGARDAIAMATKMGYLTFVITNQPDVARGTQTKEEVERINQFLYDNLPITKFYVCYHDDRDECSCRKPKTGMIREAQKEFNIDLEKSWVIGDSWRDTHAGVIAGCKTILINNHYIGIPTLYHRKVKDISEIVDIIGE